MTKNWFLYIILTKNNKLYTGITTDVARRFEAHKNGTGAKFLKANPPDKIIYQEECDNRSDASKREIFIKGLSREEKLKLCANHREAKA